MRSSPSIEIGHTHTHTEHAQQQTHFDRKKRLPFIIICTTPIEMLHTPNGECIVYVFRGYSSSIGYML